MAYSKKMIAGPVIAIAALAGFFSAMRTITPEARGQDPAVKTGRGETGTVLPPPSQGFQGTINLRSKDSIPDFPKPIRAPKGAPNVLLVLLDDVGFGATSTFGGPCSTPTLDTLARNGLKYNQFHTTALCSPTRAALITGRNHHSAHTGVIMEAGTGYPGYNTMMTKETATVAEILKQNGYGTAWFGKNHNVPDWQTSQAGPFDLWPTGLGFDHFYGFIGGDTSQWRPAVTEGTKPIDPYLGKKDYNFDYDIANRASQWISMQKAVDPDKPFFCYYAPGATHAPHHPKKEWVEKYKGKFDQGWDKLREETLERQKRMGIVPANTRLTPLAPGLPAWNTLNEDQKKVYARYMEVYAGFLEQTDHNIGRVLETIRQTGELDNTLVIYIAGDNGASAEGSPQGLLNEMTFFNGYPEDPKQVLNRMEEIGTWKTYNHYPAGWAHALCTPFQWTKQIASHYGGTRNGMVISWPKEIRARGELRAQWHHCIDIVPTILEACRITAPASVNGVPQKPIEGVSMAYTFGDSQAKSRRTKQYFELMGNRALYKDGWVACTTPPNTPWDPAGASVDEITGYAWELYHTNNDFSQSENLALKMPEKLRDLQLEFYAEAAKFNVLPIDNSKTSRLDPAIRPSLTRGRKSFRFTEGMIRIPEGASPDIKNKSWSITADLEVTEGGQGMVVTQGGLFGGWALYLNKGKPVFHYNFLDLSRYEIAAQEPLPAGKHRIVMEFAYDGGGMGKGGTVSLSADGKSLATGRVEKTIPIRVTIDETLDIGEDTGTPVSLGYDVPFKLNGKLEKVIIDLK